MSRFLALRNKNYGTQCRTLILLLLLCRLSNFHLFSQEGREGFKAGGDIFGTRVFIENKGQFDTCVPQGFKVYYAVEDGEQKLYLTDKGLIFLQQESKPYTHEEIERMERGKKVEPKEGPRFYVYQTFPGAAAFLAPLPLEKQSHYFTYGERELNSCTFKRLRYSNVYPGIDLEYFIPKDRSMGFKYNFIVHPGADPSKIRVLYKGDVKKLKLEESGEALIRTKLYDIIESKPYSHYENGTELKCQFKKNGDSLSFVFPEGVDRDRTFVIDPFVAQVNNFSTNNLAYDVDYDFGGNTFIFGGKGYCKVSMYNLSGILQWTFSGSVISQGWNSQIGGVNGSVGNFVVDRFLSKAYVGQGANFPTIVRLTATGNYDNFITATHNLYQELWDMGFHCMSGEIFLLGGGHTSNMSSATINTLSASLSLTTFQPTNLAFVHDISTHIMDDYGNIFVYYACSNAALNHRIARVNSTFNGNVWTVASGYSALAEINNKNNYGGGGISSAGYNGLAANQSYLYYYDGAVLAAYDKTTGSQLGSINVGLGPKTVGGVAVDNCNRVYCGMVDAINTYSFNGTTFSLLSTTNLNTGQIDPRVYDIKLNKGNQTLYISGKEFVKTMVAIYPNNCPAPVSVCVFNQAGVAASSTSITCATLGSATVSANGGIGPFTYTWFPSAQTGSVATGLIPGTYTVVVGDAGSSMTYTTTTTFVSAIPLTGTISSTFMLACQGVHNGTAAVLSLSGGSGNQSYLWTNGTNTYTTATVQNMAAGQYSLTVTDALTGCVFSPTLTIYQPAAQQSFISASSPSACVGNSVSMSVIASGGVPPYTYTWTGGSTAGGINVSQLSAGPVSYSVLVKDGNNCLDTAFTSINYVAYPVLSLSHSSICPLESGTVTANGATTYTWNSTVNGASLVDNPMSTQIYTVQGEAFSCISTATAQIFLKSVPTPTIWSNSPKCEGSNLQFSVSAGVSAYWTGANGFTSNQVNNILAASVPIQSGVYQVTVTAANACTAATQAGFTIHPTPTLSAAGATVCVSDVINLGASSGMASVFMWTGPQAFISLQQNPGIASAALLHMGSYSVTAVSAQNCTNQSVVQVSVTSPPVLLPTANSPLCFGKTLNLSQGASISGLSTQWSGPNGFVSSQTHPAISQVGLLNAGVYSVNVIHGPCSVNSSVQVIVNPLPQLSIYNTGPVCEGKTYTLGANSNSVTYLWTGPAGFISQNAWYVFSSAQMNQAGQYTLLVTDQNGCQSIAFEQVSVKQNPVVNAFGDQVCFGYPALLQATGADSYNWSGPLNFSANSSQANITAALNTLPWVYSVMGTALNGCTAIATCTLSTFPLPVPSITLTPRVCVQEVVNMHASGGVTYEWLGPLGFHSQLQAPVFIAQNTGQSGTYTLMVTDEKNCRNRISADLIVDPAATAVMKADRYNGCVPFCSGFSLQPVNSSATQNIRWEFENQSVNSPQFNHCFRMPGTFTISAAFENENNCKGTVFQWIEVFPNPVADFVYSPLKPVENQDYVVFTNNSTGIQQVSWNWAFNNDGNKTYSGQNVEKLFEEAGQYVVALLVKNNWGCSDTILKVIEVQPDYHVFVPNSFTPNEDGRNDYFFPVCRGVKSFQLQVFNRWGEMIYSGQDQPGWDGNHAGTTCSQGTYTYLLKVIDVYNEKKEYQGAITLIR